MRWIQNVFLKKNNFFKIKNKIDLKSLIFTNFFFYKYYKFFFYRNLSFFFFRQQVLSLGNIIFYSSLLKKKFLLIDDLNSLKETNSINLIMFPNLLFFFKFFKFIYVKNKTKKVFFIYLNNFLKRNNICFILFSNESFYRKNITLFSRFKVIKLAFVSNRFFYPLLDYCFVIPNENLLNQRIVLSLIYSLLKSSYFERLKVSNKLFLEKSTI